MFARSRSSHLSGARWWLALFIGVMTWFSLALVSTVRGEEEKKVEAKTEAPNTETTEAKPEEEVAFKPKGKGLRVNCLADENSIEEMKRRQADIDKKEKDIATREAELQAKEAALASEIKTLRDLKNEIRATEDLQGAKQQENVARMVEMVENMSPKAAAQVLSKLNDSIAIAAMKQLPATKLAKIMNSIEPTKASKLSELLATGGFPASRSPTSEAGEEAK